jgi:PAS domain S-box-containing protein
MLLAVLSLKGSILYASSNLTRILEYEPAELAGKGLLHLCHPSDLVSVLRELRECSVGTHPSISLVYRIRRKYSGFMWIEANGKLHGQSSSHLSPPSCTDITWMLQSSLGKVARA